MSKGQALAFANEHPERTAVSVAGARSQIETCVAYGLDYKPMEVSV